MVYLV